MWRATFFFFKKKEQVASVESANQMTAWLYQTQPTSHSKGGGALFKNYLLYVLVPTGGSFLFLFHDAAMCIQKDFCANVSVHRETLR